MNLVKENVVVRGDTLTFGQKKWIKEKVDKWIDDGQSSMAIMYFLGQNFSVSSTYEGDKLILTCH